jgi:hypothetical protein
MAIRIAASRVVRPRQRLTGVHERFVIGDPGLGLRKLFGSGTHADHLGDLCLGDNRRARVVYVPQLELQDWKRRSYPWVSPSRNALDHLGTAKLGS